jgi:hypothetical protein
VHFILYVQTQKWNSTKTDEFLNPPEGTRVERDAKVGEIILRDHARLKESDVVTRRTSILLQCLRTQLGFGELFFVLRDHHPLLRGGKIHHWRLFFGRDAEFVEENDENAIELLDVGHGWDVA